MNLLVTGFGPFLTNTVNPSSVLAAGSGCAHSTLEVSYSAVDAFLEESDLRAFDGWLMIGLAVNATKMRLEGVARNWIGSTPDVTGRVAGPGPIDPKHPEFLASTLWAGSPLVAETEFFAPSVDAGDYLCNYLLFRGLSTLPDLPIGFLHIPSFDTLSERKAADQLHHLISLLNVL